MNKHMAYKKLQWDGDAWADYIYWQSQDKKTLKRINLLISDILRNPYEGIGKPEALKDNLSGLWSRRIDEKIGLYTSLTTIQSPLFLATTTMIFNTCNIKNRKSY